MGVRQSKRSVDITTTPSKQADADAGRVEKIKEEGQDAAPPAKAVNGTTPAKGEIAADRLSPETYRS
ncbi:hypothetical protein J437_LFUL001576 [Ladona fulva]|uniref:Uncharacterized protein n=1 Tax=Ladona fulva TaxID=123851 RepID=A0A8K0KJS6_LADFU|nr:hypothetical protein J437_LFUL001576 [Ladona fulva]